MFYVLFFTMKPIFTGEKNQTKNSNENLALLGFFWPIITQDFEIIMSNNEKKSTLSEKKQIYKIKSKDFEKIKSRFWDKDKLMRRKGKNVHTKKYYLSEILPGFYNKIPTSVL